MKSLYDTYSFENVLNSYMSPRRFAFGLVVVFMVIFSFEGYSQTNPKEILVNFSGRKQPLKKVIVDLAKSTKVNISFSDNLIPVDSLISFSFKRTSVNDILLELLKDTNADVVIMDNDIVLVRRKIDRSKKYNLYGYIEDFESGEKLINALIYFPSLEISTVTNDYGFYSLKVPGGKHRMTIQYLAYKELSKVIPIYKNTEYNISMNPLAMLNEIVIRNKYDQKVYSSNQGFEIPLELAHSLMAVGGESNIMKIIGSGAGVSSAADQISGISVRGGNPSQNLVLIDGVPIYNANHALGIFSIFNNDVLKSVKFYKGAFPSRYSGGLSSVIDIKTKDGNFKKHTGNISLGLFSVKGNIEGPIVKDVASYMVSLRRSTIDPWLNLLLNLANQSNDGKERYGNYYLYDFNTKINYKLNKNNRLYFSGYYGKDKMIFSVDKNQLLAKDSTLIGYSKYDLDYSNKVFSLRLNTNWRNDLFSNVTAYSTGYVYSSFDTDYNKIVDGSRELDWYDGRLFNSDLHELGLKIDFDYMGIGNHIMKFGVKATNSYYKPGLKIVDEDNEFIPKLTIPNKSQLIDELSPYTQSTINLNAYIEDEFVLVKNIYLNLGFNFNSYIYNSKTQIDFDPRFSAMYKLGNLTINTGFSMMTQFNHLLTNKGLGIPFRIWVPTANDMKLEKSWIASFGISYLSNETTKWGMDVYYKQMKNIYSLGSGLISNIDMSGEWADNLPVGNAVAYGAEFSVLKNIGKTVFDLNYTLSSSVNHFEEVNQGKSFFGSYDRRHMLNIGFTQKINKNAEFSATWKYATGNPITIGTTPFLVYDSEGSPFITYFIEEINGERLPDYHRLDLGFNIYSDYSWGKQKIALGVINAYNWKNPYYLDIDINGIESIEYKQYYLIPIMPTITYSISFK